MADFFSLLHYEDYLCWCLSYNSMVSFLPLKYSKIVPRFHLPCQLQTTFSPSHYSKYLYRSPCAYLCPICLSLFSFKFIPIMFLPPRLHGNSSFSYGCEHDFIIAKSKSQFSIIIVIHQVIYRFDHLLLLVMVSKTLHSPNFLITHQVLLSLSMLVSPQLTKLLTMEQLRTWQSLNLTYFIPTLILW